MRGDDLRIVLTHGERLGIQDLPPRERAGDAGEGQHEVQREAPDIGADQGPRPSTCASTVDRWLIASSSPTTTKQASRLEPP